MCTWTRFAGAVGSFLAAASEANVMLSTVPIANAGNASDFSGFGSVGYDYRMSKFEITAGEYTEFLNAVGATDTFALYSASMSSNAQGCKITRSGVSGSFTYAVAADYANRPVNFIKLSAAMRFANWLHNGQPTGPQSVATTEDGSYFLNGATTAATVNAVTRKPNATWVLPTENEWYKAAYHKNDGSTANYFAYPTSSDAVPGRDMTELTSPGNNANYTGTPLPIDSGLYYTTLVGEFELSASPYGTFDQGGNVVEWTETVSGASNHVVRGGAFSSAVNSLIANNAGVQGAGATTNFPNLGFRLALIPSPGSMTVLLFGGMVSLRRRR